jgi:hypothetical protein
VTGPAVLAADLLVFLEHGLPRFEVGYVMRHDHMYCHAGSFRLGHCSRPLRPAFAPEPGDTMGNPGP